MEQTIFIFSLSLYIYIYIYREREREREEDAFFINVQGKQPHISVSLKQFHFDSPVKIFDVCLKQSAGP